MRRKESLSIIGGNVNGAATLENSLEVSQNVKHRVAIRTSHSTPRSLPSQMFIIAFSIIAKNWKWPTYSSVDERTYNMCISTQRKLSDNKGMKLLQPGEPWRHRARWKNSVMKDHVLHGSVYRACPEGRLVVSYGSGGWRQQRVTDNGHVSCWNDRNILKFDGSKILELALKSTDLYI